MTGKIKNPKTASIFTFIAVLIFFAAINPVTSGDSAVAEESPGEVAELYRIFDVGEVSSHFIIAVDTSLSMKDSYQQVRDALQALASSIKKGDRVTIISFNNEPKTVFEGKMTADGENVLERLPKAPDKDGKRTDIGKALESVITTTGKSDNGLELVFFLTDGRDDPPESSEYRSDAAANWEKLKKRAAQLRSKNIIVHGIGLNANTDIDLLKKVFPKSTPITLSPGELKNYFVTLEEEIRSEKLLVKLDKELSAGKLIVKPVKKGSAWGAVESGGDLEREYEVVSRYRHLSAAVSINGAKIRVLKTEGESENTGDRFKLTVIGGGTFDLAPGASRKIKIKIKAPKMSRSYRLGSGKEKYAGAADLGLTATLLPRKGLEALERESEASKQGGNIKISFYRPVGIPYATAAAALLAAVVFAGLIVRTVFIPAGRKVRRYVAAPPLSGRLAFSGAPGGKPLPGPVSLSSFGKKAVIGSSGEILLPDEGVSGRHAELFSGWVAGRPAVFIRRLDGDVTVSTSALEPKRTVIDGIELKPGSVIEIGGYRIQWL